MEEKAGEILRLSWEVFSRYGIRSISMDDLSRRLGISKKTLYLHVQDKAELVEHVLSQRHADDVAFMEVLSRKSLNAIDYLLDMSRDVCLRISQVNPALMYDLRKYYPGILERLAEMKRVYYKQLFQQNLEAGISQGYYREDLNKELTIMLYIRSMEQFFGEDMTREEGVNPSEVFRVMFENHIHSIANEKGIRYYEQKKHTLSFHL